MAPRRFYESNVSLHVIHRGNNRMTMFGDETDFEVFVALLKRGAERSGVHVHGFVLMTNHYHLVVTPSDATALARAMKWINGKYVRHFNRRYDRIGTFVNGRFGAIGLHNRVYWLTCLRYVELNPVAVKMVDAAEAYRWSSYSAHAFGAGHGWLASHPYYESLGQTDAARQSAYRAMCKFLLSPAELALQKLRR
jgi:putative transposase